MSLICYRFNTRCLIGLVCLSFVGLRLSSAVVSATVILMLLGLQSMSLIKSLSFSSVFL